MEGVGQMLFSRKRGRWLWAWADVSNEDLVVDVPKNSYKDDGYAVYDLCG